MLSYCCRCLSLLAELKDDVEIVRAAISQRGLELQHASLRLRADPEIVRLACASDGCALAYCPIGPTLEELTNDRQFMRDVVLAKRGSGEMWKLASPMLKADPDLLLLAIRNGLRMREVPDKFYFNLPFWQKCLEVDADLYMEMPPRIQAESSLAWEAILSPYSSPELHRKALECCPLLKLERGIVLMLCQRGDVELLRDLLNLPSSRRFCDDVEVMAAAVSRDPSLLALASSRLRETPERFLAGITASSAYNTLQIMGHAVMLELPEIPTKAVKVCYKGCLRYLPALIPNEIWANYRPLCLAWLQRGGDVLEAFRHHLEVEPPYTPENIELSLAVARYNWREMDKVGLALRRDKAFMRHALERDPRILQFVAPELRSEFDIIDCITPKNALTTLADLGDALIRELPEIATQAVKVCNASNMHHLQAIIPDDVWGSCRALCLAWIQRGGDVLEAFWHKLQIEPPYTPEDVELPLAVARYNWQEMDEVGSALLGDRDFVLKALEVDGRIFRFASPELRQELDIQVAAVANYNNNIPPESGSTIEEYLGGYMDLVRLARYVEEQLQLHRVFCHDILGAIAISRPHRPPQLRCRFPMLDLGDETSQVFKKLIAAYLDVPLGHKSSLLIRAITNLLAQNQRVQPDDAQQHASLNEFMWGVPNPVVFDNMGDDLCEIFVQDLFQDLFDL